jgi:hydrogenase maturation factor
MAVTSDRAPSLFEALASAGVSAAAIGAVTSAVGQIDVG